MPKWSPAEIPDRTGLTAVVTGANSGLGFHTALELARHGAHVVMACRDEARGEAARARLVAETGTAVGVGTTEVAVLDLADLASVRRFAAVFSDRNDRCHILVNNAGVMALPRRSTADGFEMQLGTNHLGHFALTGLLLPRLLAGPHTRVVTVSSGAHNFGRIDFGDLQSERRYRRWGAYGQSKLANLLFMQELARRAEAEGAPLVSVAAHPGFASTELQKAGPRMEGSRLKERVMTAVSRVVAQSAAAGALPVLYAATMADVRPGEYFGPDGPGEARGAPTRVPMSARARDTEVARRLWEESERLTGVRYDWARTPAAH